MFTKADPGYKWPHADQSCLLFYDRLWLSTLPDCSISPVLSSSAGSSFKQTTGFDNITNTPIATLGPEEREEKEEGRRVLYFLT